MESLRITKPKTPTPSPSTGPFITPKSNTSVGKSPISNNLDVQSDIFSKEKELPPPSSFLLEPPKLQQKQIYLQRDKSEWVSPLLLDNSSPLVKSPRMYLPDWWDICLKNAQVISNEINNQSNESTFTYLISGSIAIILYLNELLFIDKNVLTEEECKQIGLIIFNIGSPNDIDFHYNIRPTTAQLPFDKLTYSTSEDYINILEFKVKKMHINNTFILNKDKATDIIFKVIDIIPSFSIEGNGLNESIVINKCKIVGLNNLIYKYTKNKRTKDKQNKKIEILNFIYNCIIKMNDSQLNKKYGITVEEPQNKSNLEGGYYKKYLKYKHKYLELKYI
jgi:hypothetical protein